MVETTDSQPDALKNVFALSEYRITSESRVRLFPSDGSLEWYIRHHRADLVARNAMLKIRGTWYVHAERFDQAVLDIAATGTKVAA